jgi:hypothetical protein
MPVIGLCGHHHQIRTIYVSFWDVPTSTGASVSCFNCNGSSSGRGPAHSRMCVLSSWYLPPGRHHESITLPPVVASLFGDHTSPNGLRAIAFDLQPVRIQSLASVTRPVDEVLKRRLRHGRPLRTSDLIPRVMFDRGFRMFPALPFRCDAGRIRSDTLPDMSGTTVRRVADRRREKIGRIERVV